MKNKTIMNKKAGSGIFGSRNAKECLFVIFISFLISCFSAFVSADTLYWVGGSNGNWSDSSNWASSSGGAGGAGVPNATNAVIFNSANLNNSMINDSIAVYNLTISGYTGTISFTTNVSADLNITQNFYLGSGATISPTYSSLTADGGNGTGRIISVGGNATILGTINGDGLGFPTGQGPGCIQQGGYGGKGGIDSGATPVYGSLTQPIALGSGSQDGAGGGAIKLNVTGTLILNGAVSVNGGTGGIRGAAGGSIWLISNTFTGNGTINAIGGIGNSISTDGGGGRVAIEYTTSTYAGSVSVAMGRGPTSTAQPGTLWEPHRFDNLVSGNVIINTSYQYYFPNQTNYNWNLTINNAIVYFHNGTMNISNLALNSSTLRFDVNDSGDTGINKFQMVRLSITNNINLTGSSNLYLPAEGSYNLAGNLDVASGSTLYSLGNSTAINSQSGGTVAIPHGIGVGINVGGNATILGMINAINVGFPIGIGPGYQAQVGSYGGKGGTGYGGTPTSYGSLTQPTALGSGGGNTIGGGAIKLNVTKTLILNGSISASSVGGSTYGAAGGSIWLISNTFTGNGTINADATGYYAGNGGGGRIAIEYNSSTFVGTVLALGGSHASPPRFGQSGTYFLCSSSYMGACSSGYNGMNLNTNFTISSGVINDSLNITRNIINFSRVSIRWNDTSTNVSNVAVYNITGLIASNPGYYLYIDNVLNQSMTTDSDGNLPLFNITLSSARTIEILDAVPNVAFTGQTPANGSYQNYTSIFVNVSTNDTNEHYVVNDFDNSLVGWWRLEQGNGTFFVDDSRYGNNGSCSSTTCPVYNVSGKFGGSMGFDGVEDYVNAGSNQSLNLTNVGTVSLWAKPIYASGNNVLLSRGDIWNAASGYGFWNWGVRLYFGIINSTGSSNSVESPSSLSQNNWAHLVGTWNGTTVSFYKDGVLKANVTQTINATPSGNLIIGANNNGANVFFNGSIDEVLIFNRSLSVAEIGALYNASANKYYNNFTSLGEGNHTFNAYAIDVAGNKNSTGQYRVVVDTTSANGSILNYSDNTYLSNGTAKNFTLNITDNLGIKNATLHVEHQGNYWLDFDGVNNVVTIADNASLRPLTENFTWSVWVNFKNLTGGRILTKGWVTANELPIYIHSASYNFVVYGDSGSINIVSGVLPVIGNWYNVALIRSGSNMSIYVNGIYKSSDSTADANISSTSAVKIGQSFNGSIDEVRIYNRSLSSAEITAIYENELKSNVSIVNSSGLVAYYDFNEGSGTTLIDRATGVNNGTITGATWANEEVVTVSFVEGVLNGVIGVVKNLLEGVYKWWWEVFDWAGNRFVTQTQTITIDTTKPLINFTAPTPDNNSGRSNNFIINASIIDTNLANVTYNWNSSTATIRNYSSTYVFKNMSSLLNGLVLMMNFDNDTNYGENSTLAYDFSGNENNGTISGAVYNQSGKYGGAYTFNTSSNINARNNSNLFLTHVGTVSVWVKGAEFSGFRCIVSKHNLGADRNGYGLCMNAALLYNQISDDTTSNMISGTSLLLNTWYHIVMTWNGTNFSNYVNNIVVASSAQTFDAKSDVYNLKIGGRGDSASAGIFNGTIDEVMIWNRSLSADEVKQVYYSRLQKFPRQNGNFSVEYNENTSLTSTKGNATINLFSYDTEMRNFNVIINQTGLQTGNRYSYNISVTDLAGNTNVTETRTLTGNSVPLTITIAYSPNITLEVDPSVFINITANISDVDNNFDTAFVQWRNTTANDWTNITMTNLTIKNYYTLANASFSLPAYESNITFRLWMNDTIGDSNYTGNYTLQSFWDCGWLSDNDLSGSGWDENRWVTNLSLNNTGDASYATNNCSLDFRLTYDLAEGRIYFDNVKYKPSSTYTLAAKANTTIKINATFGTEVKLENTIITINEVSTRSANSTANSSLTLVSNQNGPYLYQKISSYPTIVYLNTSGNFSLQGYLRNLMGSAIINENNTAYNVSFYWGLPSGLTNSSGNLTMNYTNLTDNSLYYNDIYAEFSNLATMSAGIRNITLNAYGYNLTGSLIKDSNNLTLLTESVSINFLCYNISDGVYVSPCGALDGDYVAPVASSGSSGGGAGGGGGAGKESKSEKSFATFELVRGKDNSFSFEIRNKYELPMEKIKIKVSGIKAEYISVEPNEIALLEPKSALNISVKISSPAYFTQGSYTLDFEIKGELVSNESRIGVTEMKKATLIILEMNRENASALFDSMKEMVAKMNESGMNLEQVNKIMVGANGNYDKLKFLELKGEYESAKKIYENAFEAKKIIDELKAGIADAEKQGISALETKKLMYLAEAIFVRGDYALALERLKEAKLTYALEVKGEFSLLYAIKNNPGESAGVALATVLLSLGSGFLVRLKLYKNKLRALQEEEKLLLELMKVVQRECFEKNRMSMEEYGEAMSQYEIKLSKTIEEKIRIETKITNLLKLRGKKKALYEEKERLIALMKKVQDEYLNKGKIESRIYDNMIKSYSTRLSEIEEAITFFDAEEALQSDKLFYRFLRAVRLRKGAGR